MGHASESDDAAVHFGRVAAIGFRNGDLEFIHK